MLPYTIRFNKGDRYLGEVNIQGVPNGAGRLIDDENGIRYIGNFRDGLAEGYGVIELKKLSYEGEWKQGSINGRGTVTFARGGSFTGCFVNGSREGKGVFTCKDGTKIEQTYENDILTDEKAPDNIPVLTITDECKKYGSWHRIICRFAAKVGEFTYNDMQQLDIYPWDCDDALERRFIITEVTENSVTFTFRPQLSGGEERTETVYRGKLGSVENNEVRIGSVQEGISFDYRSEAKLSVSCE